MDYFTLITGLISVLSFGLQVFGLLPQLGRAREIIFLVFLGIFLGSLLRTVEGVVKVDLEIDFYTVIVALFVFVILGFLIGAALTHDAVKRGEFYGVASVAFLVFIFVLVAGGISSIGDSAGVERRDLTISELQLLSDHAVKKGDLDRAIMHLRTIEIRLLHDERAKIIRQRIDELKQKELETPP
jgi:hypothetical protein